ncbi:MAG: protein kinase domain-containing protein [Thermoanaerobaculia bacterium]
MELGSYRLIDKLGAGGMGEVWRAEDRKLLRQVAIKILPEQLATDSEWKERFLREARNVAQLNHPNIATIYSIDQQGETLFIAMELIEGEALSSMIARGPMVPADAVRVAAHGADGLGEAHEKGIIHRDIKPDNILVSKKIVKILDFGIAKQIGGTADPALTQGGMVMGTPHYMSPEQALGRNVDARTDIFSLGTVLYEMLSGVKPFSGDAATQVLLQIVMQEPRDIALAAFGITPALAGIVRRCMAKQVDERFQSCVELREALVSSLREDPSRSRESQVPTLGRRLTPHPRGGAATTPLARSSSPSAVRPSTGDRRALVADDDPATRYLLGSVLERYQIAYDEAANGADAVKFLKNNEYSFVFVDLLMPRLDGWGVLDYLRNHRSQHMPRTFIVTGVLNQKLSTADQDVVTGLLYKPLDIAQVEKLVAVSTGAREARRRPVMRVATPTPQGGGPSPSPRLRMTAAAPPAAGRFRPAARPSPSRERLGTRTRSPPTRARSPTSAPRPRGSRISASRRGRPSPARACGAACR